MSRALLVVVAFVVALLLLLVPSLARAQFVNNGANLEAPSGEAVDDTKLRGRISTSGLYFTETASDPMTNDASPVDLVYSDIRARIEAEHIDGGKWNALGDLRLRVAQSDLSARGWVGGNEVDLREVYATRKAGPGDFAVGRMIMRDVDSTTIDGVAFRFRKSAEIELGAFAGMYPSPFSRSLQTDYVPDDAALRTISDMPIAAGAWAGYRYQRLHGSIGLAAVLPRDQDPAEEDLLRTFATAQGYFRVKPGIDVFHYAVFDITGEAEKQLMNLQLGLHWRAQPRLVVEAGYSHMSTYAISLYVRDLLEDATPLGGAPPVNNLVLARMGADEGRVGATYNMIEKRVDLYGMGRYRRRDALDDPALPMEIAALPPDTQIDVTVGARKKKAFGGWTVGANVTVIDGGRTSSYYGQAMGQRTFLQDKLDLQLDVGYVAYEDVCADPADLTCTGTAKGTSIRGGGSVVYRRDRHWMFIGDYRLNLNSATATVGGVANTARPDITGHTVFVRGQYTF